ncbi:MAG: hypothetical protein ACE5J9_03765 [Methanosarcinales archaeon]
MQRRSNGRVLHEYTRRIDAYDDNLLSKEALENMGKWYMDNIGAGATFEKCFRYIELANGDRIWWAEIVDNEWEEKVADWIFDENGKNLLCYPDPSEFDRILIEIDRKHGFDEWHRPIKKEKVRA